MGLHVTLATPADDASIRGLLRREPVGGRISISYERDPDFAIGCQATGDNVTVLVARDLDNPAIVGVAAALNEKSTSTPNHCASATSDSCALTVNIAAAGFSPVAMPSCGAYMNSITYLRT